MLPTLDGWVGVGPPVVGWVHSLIPLVFPFGCLPALAGWMAGLRPDPLPPHWDLQTKPVAVLLSGTRRISPHSPPTDWDAPPLFVWGAVFLSPMRRLRSPHLNSLFLTIPMFPTPTGRYWTFFWVFIQAPKILNTIRARSSSVPHNVHSVGKPPNAPLFPTVPPPPRNG